MHSRRSSIEIIADILRLGETGKTDILYSCDLSYHQLQKYLDFLIAHGFLELDGHNNPRKHYKPTADGKQLLSHIDEVRLLLGLRDHDEATVQVEGNSIIQGGLAGRLT